MPTEANPPSTSRRRRLRAVFAADVADFGGFVSADETHALQDLWHTRRIANEALAAHGGWLFGMPGDGIFALFESAVDAVRCALITQSRLAALSQFNRLRLRIGIHLGEVVFQDEQPFGEALVIAARLESLAEPGSILISAAVMDAVAPRISAIFEAVGIKSLKHIPRRIATFRVKSMPDAGDGQAATGTSGLRGQMVSDSMPEPLNTTQRQHSRRGSRLDATATGRATGNRLLDTTVAKPGAPLSATGSGLDKSARSKAKAGLSATAAGRPSVEPVPILPLGKPALTRASDATRTPLRGKEPDDLSDPAAAGGTELRTCLPELTLALTKYIGPLAKLIAGRHAGNAKSLDDLIGRLAAEIAAPRDRDKFLAEARSIAARKAR